MTTHLEREIYTQPSDWRAAVERASEVRDLLPAAGATVATLGCGTSWFMGQAYAALREASGAGAPDAFAASDHRLARGYDGAVIICRSGTTTEVVDIVAQLHDLDTPHVSFVATPGTPVAEQSTKAVLMDAVDEQSVVQTRFATTTLALLRATLGEDLEPAIADAEAVLAESDEDSFGHLLDAEQVTFLGTGWTIGLAHEAALKLRESAQFWAESYNAMEYRHGPKSIAGPGRVVWAFGDAPEGLADEVRATGAHFEHRDIDPMADLVRAHRYALAMALARDLNPDEPRNLTRSIVLT